MYKGKLFVLSGPSGAGKGTICKALLEQSEEIKLSVSMTTRTPRNGEVEGESYFFVTKVEFERRIAEDGFLEYAEVYGNYYGTPKAKVMQLLDEGYDVILEIDIQGALKIRDAFPMGILIFILPPSMSELRKRITGRGSETEESINVRLGQTLKEVSYIYKYDYCVVNGEVEEATKRVRAVIEAEHSRVSADIYELIDKYKEEV